LGDLKDFQNLITAAKRNNVRLILDGVLNHCGRDFFAFVDLLENAENSDYKDWFHVYRFPLRAYGRGKATDYAAWWGIRDLPKLNTDNPRVRKYLFDMTRYWMDQGIDGWRLDVPNEIGFPFWEEYSAVVKGINPDAYLVGEIWNLDPSWVNGHRFDALMNYPLRKLLLEGLDGTTTASGIAADANTALQAYPLEHSLVMYNLLTSHDTKRVLSALGGSVSKAKLAYAALFAFPGAPAIYYGDEVGMRGGEEPASRGSFPWDEKQWNAELRQWIKKLITLRKDSVALRRGDFRLLAGDDATGLFSFARKDGQDQVTAVFNFSKEPRKVLIKAVDLGGQASQLLKDLLSGQSYQVAGGNLELTVPAWGAAWLTAANY
jgi:glycosidase